MGKNSILTIHQRRFLDQINRNKNIITNYYFTGGTALSEFYLHHRYSDDLDFFSNRPINKRLILTFIESYCHTNKYIFKSEFIEVVYRFNIRLSNNANLKIDFSYDPIKRIETGTKYKNIEVDSLMDIAINKIITVSQRVNVKDFVDLYFLLKEYSVWDLIAGAKVKYRMVIEPFVLAADLLIVDSFDSLPKMIKPLTLNQLKLYFHNEAKKLGSKVI